MNIYLLNLWNHLKTNFWLLPALMTFASFLLSFITLNLDRSLETNSIHPFSIWQGGAEGARELLSTIAGSVITITGVVFSITTVSLALTSNQYGSKLLPNFIKDIGTQIVLGTFISTSIYTLLILRTIKGQGINNEPFVPNLSISVSMALALASLSLLIYFIHHLSVRIQSADIISRVANELIYLIESLPNSAGKTQTDNFPEQLKYKDKITSAKIGYLQAIDYKGLSDLAKKHQFRMEIGIRSGHFIKIGTILAATSSSLSKELYKLVVDSFIIDKVRSPTQDLEYAIDQLVTIALRALSTHSNDAFTANSCIDYLGAALCLACKKNLKPPFYDNDSFVKLASKQQTFEGLVDASFNQIRQSSTEMPSVLIHLLETLSSVIPCAQTEEQKTALKRHAMMIKNLESRLIEEQDRKDLQNRYYFFISEFEN